MRACEIALRQIIRVFRPVLRLRWGVFAILGVVFSAFGLHPCTNRNRICRARIGAYGYARGVGLDHGSHWQAHALYMGRTITVLCVFCIDCLYPKLFLAIGTALRLRYFLERRDAGV